MTIQIEELGTSASQVGVIAQSVSESVSPIPPLSFRRFSVNAQQTRL